MRTLLAAPVLHQLLLVTAMFPLSSYPGFFPFSPCSFLNSNYARFIPNVGPILSDFAILLFSAICVPYILTIQVFSR